MITQVELAQEVMTFCDIAKPIYVKMQDYLYLNSTDHGKQLLEWISYHNDKIIELCRDIPRTLIEGRK
jgi:hypothetical protein